MTDSDVVGGFQEAGHGPEHDYVNGSPHLKHPGLREWVVSTVLDTVRAVTPADRPARVLEVGAGHGPLTDHLVRAGADVVVTEMSVHSADVLRARYEGVDGVTVVHDPRGELDITEPVDVVLYISVLHHIPDYLTAVRHASELIRPGGAMVSFQDPLWYPRRRRSSLLAAKIVYWAWRMTQGELRRGAATLVRRLRGVYDESLASDMVEYHVVRQGVDEEALAHTTRPLFERVEVLPYWSTQSTVGQRIGRRLLSPNTFGLVAVGRTADT